MIYDFFLTFVANYGKSSIMKLKGIGKKLFSRYVLFNLAAMVVVIFALCMGVKYALAAYTHQGVEVIVPDLYGKDYFEMETRLAELGIGIEVSDTGYNKRMPADCVLAQTPGAGNRVKEGRIIYVTINSDASPALTIPDIIDNSSYREAQARLTAIGFRLLEPEIIDGERDWVYGVKAGGKILQSGDKVAVETPLTLVIGNGTSSANEDQEDAMLAIPNGSEDDFDDFEEVMD